MKASCGSCGQEWQQSGNKTGHCSGCHQTFGSITAFDRHQHVVDEEVICRHPEAIGLKPTFDALGARVWKFPPPEGGMKAVFSHERV